MTRETFVGDGSRHGFQLTRMNIKCERAYSVFVLGRVSSGLRSL